MDYIIKKASAFTVEELEADGLTGIPANWPVKSEPYVDLVPEGWEQLSDTALAQLRSDNQDSYNSWLAAKTHIYQNEPALVRPTVVFNEHLLVPKGMKKLKFKAEDYCKVITLSNRTGSTFDFAGDLTPIVGAYITQNECVQRFVVSAVEGSTVTLLAPDGMDLDNLVLTDPIYVSNPYHADVTVEFEDVAILYLWGLTFQARNYGEDDILYLKVMAPDGEGGLVMVKPYERTWVSNVDKVGIMHTPDDAPGEIPAGIVLRIEYFTFKIDATIIHVNFDYIFTVKT